MIPPPVPADLVPPGYPHPIVLGIDPGTRNLGWGALVLPPSGPRFCACGVLAPPPRLAAVRRLGRLLDELEELLGCLRPTHVAVEGAFAARNVRSALRLGEARGLVLAAVSRREIPITEIAPASAKKAIVGHGQASKQQVARMMATLLGIDTGGVPEDATDALALAWASAQRLAFAERVGPRR